MTGNKEIDGQLEGDKPLCKGIGVKALKLGGEWHGPETWGDSKCIQGVVSRRGCPEAS